jgi:hypothetical protein
MLHRHVSFVIPGRAAIQSQRKGVKEVPERSELSRLVAEMESHVPFPQGGLPEPVFLLVSRLTPVFLTES